MQATRFVSGGLHVACAVAAPNAAMRYTGGMPYLPPHDAVDDPAELAAFIAANPLATLVTHDGTTPEADLVPLLLVDGPNGQELLGHVARANPLWSPGRQAGPVLAVFGGPQHYVSPTWYPSKAEHHRTVPTWNYVAVHVWGELVVHDDEKWVRGVVARLTNAMEGGREEPWRVGMAPPDYLADMLAQIVGISIPVQRIVGKFKVSAHKSEADRLGARDGIAADSPDATALVDLMTDPPQLRP